MDNRFFTKLKQKSILLSDNVLKIKFHFVKINSLRNFDETRHLSNYQCARFAHGSFDIDKNS